MHPLDTLHVIHYTFHVSLYTVKVTLYTSHVSLFTVHFTPYALHLHLTPYPVIVTLCMFRLYTSHLTHYTLQLAPCTHHTHYTLHTAHTTHTHSTQCSSRFGSLVQSDTPMPGQHGHRRDADPAGIGSALSSLFGKSQGSQGTEEETQGLLSVAHQTLHGVSDMASEKFNTAMQAATISRQTWATFFGLFGAGCFFVALSFTSLPFIVIVPQKFASMFTIGNGCILSSFAVIKGSGAFVQHLMAADRRRLTFGYVGSMAGTLWASMWYRSSLLTLVFVFVQMGALLWFFVSYIPGGTWVMSTVQSACFGCLGSTLCGRCANR